MRKRKQQLEGELKSQRLEASIYTARRLLSDSSYLDLINEYIELLKKRDWVRRRPDEHLKLTRKMRRLEKKILDCYQIPILYGPRELEAASNVKEALYQEPIVALLPKPWEMGYVHIKVSRDEPIETIKTLVGSLLKRLDEKHGKRRRRTSSVPHSEIKARISVGKSKSEVGREIQEVEKALKGYHTADGSKRRQVQRISKHSSNKR